MKHGLLVLCGALAALPLWAAPEAVTDAPVAAAPVAADSARPGGASGDLEREAGWLEALVRGELPQGVALGQVFPLDLLDPGVVAEQRTRLSAELQALPKPADGEAVDPARRVLELRLELVSSPRELRAALVEADSRREAAKREVEQAQVQRAQAEAEATKAEEARRKALEAAEAARTAAEKFFATEFAKVENVRLEQATLRKQLADQRVALRSGEIGGIAEEVRTRIQQAVPGAESNRGLYDEVVLDVIGARGALREALDDVDRKAGVPRYVLPPDLPADASLRDERAKLESAAAQLQSESEALVGDVRRVRHDRAAWAYERLERLNGSRIELLGKLADTDRDEILGLGQIGWDQLHREIEQLQLQFRWYRYARANLGFVWASVTEDSSRLFWVAMRVVLFVLLCVAAVWIARHRQRLLNVASVGAVHITRRDWSQRALLSLLSQVERVFPELLLVGVALLAPWVLGPLAEIAEVVLVLELFQMFAIYRLLVVLFYQLISWLSVGSGVLPLRLRRLTLRSLRLIGIYVLATLFILVLSEQMLGRGYLYSVVANIWWLGGIPIAAILVRWWQSDIADGYLQFRDTGRMAATVRASRSRWYGFFVTVVAVAVLIVVAAGSLAARFALGFDQTRKALAFLFRRRLERQADAQGEQEQPALDPALLNVLAGQPSDKPELLVEHFPGLEEFVGEAKKWKEGGPAAQTLLIGDTGFGKTTWLLRAQHHLGDAGIAVHRLVPPHNLTRATDLLAWLSGQLGVAGGDWEAFAEALAAGERKAVLIDDGHLLFSRALNGFEAWDALCSMVAGAAPKLLLLVAMTRFPYDYLVWARNGQVAPFRRTRALKAWDEEEIADLLRKRMQSVGYRVRYDDLVAERVEGVRQHTQMLRTETEYARLIWDYADGCPRTALRCWAASLVPAGKKTVSVRLFKRPDVDLLRKLSPRERFVLAALVWHQTLTPELAAEVLRFPEPECGDALAMLRDCKVALEESDGVFRLESDWLQPVRRLLRRENLIVA